MSRRPSPSWNVLHILFLVTIMISVAALSLPIATTPLPYVKGAFDAINQLAPGSKVFWCVLGTESYDPFSYYTELYSYSPMIRHLLSKNIKLITYGGQGPLVNQHDKIMAYGVGYNDMKDYPGYGTQLVDLGILPGAGMSVPLLIALCTNFNTIVKVDMYNTPLEQIPLLKEFKSARDADMIIGINMYTTQFRAYTDPTKTKYVLVFPAAPNILKEGPTAWVPGLVSGFVAGLKQGGQYEILSGQSLGASNLLPTESLLGVFVVGGIIVTNGYDLINRYVRGGKKVKVSPKPED